MTQRKMKVGDEAYVLSVQKDPSSADYLTCDGIKSGKIVLADILGAREPAPIGEEQVICAFRVFGRPPTTNQSIGQSKTHWSFYKNFKSAAQGHIVEAMRNAGVTRAPTTKKVHVEVQGHYPNKQTPDVDGIWIKPFLDGMEEWVYNNDRQIKKYSVEIIDDSPVSQKIEDPDMRCFVEVTVMLYQRSF